MWIVHTIVSLFFAIGAIFGVSPAESKAMPTATAQIASSTATISAPAPVTILAFGDLMLDRTVRTHIEQSGAAYPFQHIAPLLAGHDVVVANAEGVFGDTASISQMDHSVLRFTFATSTLATLRALGFTDLSQANNHTFDFGADALAASRLMIGAAGITPFGDFQNNDPSSPEQNIRGQRIVFVAYNEFSHTSISRVLAAISTAKAEGDFIIVYPHWGVEYNLGTTSEQVSLGHQFVDAGADVVFGSHPHVVEPVEIYNGKPIFYSLGNFVFDQSFSQETSEGLAVEVSLSTTTATYTLMPLTINRAVPALMDAPSTQIFLTQHTLPSMLMLPR